MCSEETQECTGVETGVHWCARYTQRIVMLVETWTSGLGRKAKGGAELGSSTARKRWFKYLYMSVWNQ